MTQESQSDTIGIHEEDDKIIYAMLEFCYRFEYIGAGCISSLGASQKDAPAFHAHMFAAGEKYFVQGLKDLATDHFIKSVKAASDDDLAAAIRAVYTEVSDPDKILQAVVTEAVLGKATTLLSGASTVLNDLLDALPAFGGDMTRAFAKSKSSRTPSKPQRHPPQTKRQ